MAHLKVVAEGVLFGTDACLNMFGVGIEGILQPVDYPAHAVTIRNWLEDMWDSIVGGLKSDYALNGFSVYSVDQFGQNGRFLYRSIASKQGVALGDTMPNQNALTVYATALGNSRRARKSISGLAMLSVDGNLIEPGLISNVLNFAAKWVEGPNTMAGQDQWSQQYGKGDESPYVLAFPVSVNSLIGSADSRKPGIGI